MRTCAGRVRALWFFLWKKLARGQSNVFLALHLSRARSWWGTRAWQLIFLAVSFHFSLKCCAANFHIRTYTCGLALASPHPPGWCMRQTKETPQEKIVAAPIIISGVKRLILYPWKKIGADWIEEIRGEGMCFIMRMLYGSRPSPSHDA